MATGSLIHFTSLALKPDILRDGGALKALFGGTSTCRSTNNLGDGSAVSFMYISDTANS